MDEKIEWIDKENANVKIENVISIKDDKGKEVGTKKESYFQKTTLSEIQEGMEVVKERIETNKNQMRNVERQLERLGKVPMKTNEMIRLQKSIAILNTINKAEELKIKIKSFQENIEADEKFLEKREKQLEKRPK